ncbi:MAG: fructose-bisphosphate aldolase class I [Actinomycetota bacterium]|nr:fructose-bisphosphate aldolase class I [Actinomycetota bacterium]
MESQQLRSTAQELVAGGKGILAADESTGSIEKRFQGIDVESTEENRRSYREMLFSTPGIGDFISGAILYDETIRQQAEDGTSLVELLQKQGGIPGIKVDTGAKALAGAPDEKVTEGLDGLRERLAEYVELGARFTKWRAVITIGGGFPSPYCIKVNAHALGRYAALSQEAGLVPIVEPETMMDGAHSIEQHFEVTEQTLRTVFQELYDQRVELEGALLKINMVLSGTENSQQADVEEVADRTLRCLLRTVPPAVAGVVFLSGGQSDEQATAHLNEMNRRGPLPWELSFSYGRALQAPALKAWKGERSNFEAGQRALHHRAKLNGAARSGSYSSDMENAAPAA